MPEIFAVLSNAATSLKYKFVILFFQLCAEGIIDQNVAGTDDSTDTAPEIFSADRQMNSCSIFQIRTLLLISWVNIDRKLIISGKIYRFADAFDKKIIISFRLHKFID